MLKRINFTSVSVADQDRALEFYTKKLGFKVVTDQPMGPSRWIELEIPGAETRVVLWHEPQHGTGPRPALALLADDVQTTYEELKTKGVEFTQPPIKAPWGEHAIFKDTEGNLILFAKG
jgi:predicted enzyme related to lactoylglutathione lyase